MKYKKVIVKWIDACNYQGWMDLSEAKLVYAETIGYLIKKTKKKLVICSGIGVEQFYGISVIPNKWIKSIKVLK